MIHFKMQVNDVKQKLSSIKPLFIQYEEAIKERKDAIEQAQKEIEELKSSFKDAVGFDFQNPLTISQNKLKGFRGLNNYDPEELKKAIIEVISKEENLLAKEVHERVKKLYGFNAIEETVRKKLGDYILNLYKNF